METPGGLSRRVVLAEPLSWKPLDACRRCRADALVIRKRIKRWPENGGDREFKFLREFRKNRRWCSDTDALTVLESFGLDGWFQHISTSYRWLNDGWSKSTAHSKLNLLTEKVRTGGCHGQWSFDDKAIQGVVSDWWTDSLPSWAVRVKGEVWEVRGICAHQTQWMCNFLDYVYPQLLLVT